MKSLATAMPTLRWWWPLRRHRLSVLLCGIPAALVVVLLMVYADPVFESRALLEVQHATPPQVTAGGTTYARIDMLFMNTQREIAASYAVAGGLRDHLQIDLIPDTHLLAVRYRATNPAQAQIGANTVAQSFISYTEDAQIQSIERAALLLLRKLESVIDAPDMHLRDLSDGTDKRTQQETIYEDLLSPLPPLLPGMERAQLPGNASSAFSSLLETALVTQVVQSFDDSLTPMTFARILDYAPLPEEPLERIHPLWVVLSYLSAVALPAAVLVARFKMRDTLDFPQDVHQELGLICIGTLPIVSTTSSGHFLDDLPFADALRSLRTALQLLRPFEPPMEQFPRGRTVLVTSGQSGEGKTTLAVNLALATGRMERVLLIEADMRTARPCLGLAAGVPGLSHLIAGAAQLRDCIHRPDGYGIDVIPVGVLPPNPHELLASRRFRRVLDMLERRYDTIVVDAPAVTEVSDTLLLARHCSELLYVTAAGQTTIQQARNSLAQLLQRGLPVSGVVLNRCGVTDPQQAHKRAAA
ncbi:MAG: CpsD/CapB family tyrosine-protein kinase [Gammaproteobacteria bacterium]|nr:CpsD/CapB family tyrosine-protein kinase [Gammaproteobacteria bacterium]MDP2139195.1 CpsD/CapB family tyrosine-protein kinase [Gammaproteobacteria bacterium]MDP2349036.1 CpsD/CapB family tyrosine-protein kinase [Gammaproteobacteria bacterium]